MKKNMKVIIQLLKKNYKIAFIIIFIWVIMFPNMNKYLPIIKNTTLNGVTRKIEEPQYNIFKYLSGEFQKKMESYYAENYPYRNCYIKVYNQLRYSIFREGTVVVGKDNYLFEKNYIEEYLGISKAASDEKIEKVVKILEKIDLICKEADKEFFIIITPSKAAFCSEYIPNFYYKLSEETKDNERNYDKLIKNLSNSNIKYIDSCRILREVQIDEPIFYKTGTHWSYVASTKVLEEGIKYINEKSSKKYNNIKVIGSEQNRDPFFGEDHDIYLLQNIFKGDKDKLYYKPKISVEKGVNKHNLFMQGGSFCWNLTKYLDTNVFDEIDFSFYQQFITRYRVGQRQEREGIKDNKITDSQLKNMLKNKDTIVLEVNEEAIAGWIDNGFPQVLCQYLEKYGFED